MGSSKKLHTKLVQKLILTTVSAASHQAAADVDMEIVGHSQSGNGRRNPMMEEVPTEEMQPC